MISVQRGNFWGRLFLAAWVLFPIPSAAAILASGLRPANVGVVFGFAAWGAIWVWLWMRALGRDHVGEVIAFGAITMLLSLFSLVEPLPGGTFLVFSFIIAGAIFPLRQAVWVFAGLVLLQVMLQVVRLTDPASSLNAIINDVLVGAVGAGARLLWGSYRQLIAAREEIARLAVSEERLRFSRDLHDLLGQSLAVVVLKSELVAKQLPAGTDEALRQELRDVAQVARRSLNDVREAVAGYRRPSLTGEIDHARSTLRAADIGFLVENSLGRVSAEQDAVFAWTLREAVTNVVRHSGARKCDLRLSRDGANATLEVSDDGRGASDLTGGSGIIGVRERVDLAGGRVDITSHAGGGFRLAVTIPAGMPVAIELAVS